MRILGKHFGGPRRRWQLLLVCLLVLILNIGTSMIYQSYHSIPQHKRPLDTAASSRAKDWESSVPANLFENPWFSDLSDLKVVQSQKSAVEEYTLDKVQECFFRVYKNMTAYGTADFIYEYMRFRDCAGSSPLDHWVKSNLRAATGTKGQILIDSLLEFQPAGKTWQCNAKLLIIVFSSSKRGRDKVRSSWAKLVMENPEAELIFFTSNHDNDVQESDVVSSSIDASDPNFEFKQSLAMYIWLYQNCPRAQFVLKTREDTFVNVVKILLLVNQEQYAANRLYGELIQRARPAWSDQPVDPSPEVHPVSRREWPYAKYPPFLKGPSYIITGDLVPRILMASTVIQVIPLAQVFFTGLVPLAAHIMRIGVHSFFSYSPPPGNTTDPCEFAQFGAIHGMHEEEQFQLALSMTQDTIARNESCQLPPRCLAKVEGKCMMFSKDSRAKTRQPFSWP